MCSFPFSLNLSSVQVRARQLCCIKRFKTRLLQVLLARGPTHVNQIVAYGEASSSSSSSRERFILPTSSPSLSWILAMLLNLATALSPLPEGCFLNSYLSQLFTWCFSPNDFPAQCTNGLQAITNYINMLFLWCGRGS